MSHRGSNADFFSKESDLMHQSQRALANGLEKNPIDKLRLLCFSKGSRGILELARTFRRLDSDGNKSLTLDDFITGIRKTGLSCSDAEAKEMFEGFDANRSGSVNVSDLLDKLRPPVHKNRLDVIGKAFDKVDRSRKGVISFADLKQVYSVKVHPKYKSGEMTENEIWAEFLGNFQGDKNKEKNDSISREEFINYYTSMSASIDNDTYFDLLMRQAYRL